MTSRKKSNIVSKALLHPAALTGYGLVILLLIAMPLYKNAKKQYNVNKEIKALKKEISSIEEKNTELRNLMDYLETDQFAEEQARLNLNLRKEGEEVVVIKGKNGANDNGEGEASNYYNIKGPEIENVKKQDSNPRRWLKHFF